VKKNAPSGRPLKLAIDSDVIAVHRYNASARYRGRARLPLPLYRARAADERARCKIHACATRATYLAITHTTKMIARLALHLVALCLHTYLFSDLSLSGWLWISLCLSFSLLITPCSFSLSLLPVVLPFPSSLALPFYQLAISL
jgi:hypothetical protein